jgi:hypothetical protein
VHLDLLRAQPKHRQHHLFPAGGRVEFAQLPDIAVGLMGISLIAVLLS